MKKLNIKGYMLVEIIIAFAIAFTLLYFMVDLVFKIKNNNDDLLVETVVKMDSTIITNGLMEYAKTITNKNEAKSFCDKIDVVGKTVKYGEDVIAVVDDTATLGSKNCGFANGRVKVTIPVSVKQIKDENFDIIVDYYYDNGAVCNPIMSYSCSNGKSIDSDVYAIEYDGECEVIDDGNGDWRIKFLEEGKHNLKLNCISLDVDVFLVGGGGGGGVEDHYSGGGGGGGSAKTLKNITLVENELYPIVVGAGGKASGGTGGTTSAFGESANGGNGGIGLTGGTGGFGGIGGKSGSKGGDGGNKYNAGKDGINGNINEFDEPSNGVLYGGGGGGGGGGGKYLGNDGEVGFKFKPGGVGGIGGGGVGGDSRNNARYNGGAGQKNTGGGGGGGTEYYNRGTMGSAGGSGIVIIRNARGS